MAERLQFSEREALDFHTQGRPGKIDIIASKPMATQRDLALAYSPGVAIPVKEAAPLRNGILQHNILSEADRTP